MNEELLDKYITGEANAEERKEVVEWMDSDEQNVREYMALHKVHDITVMNSDDNAGEALTDGESSDDEHRRRRPLLRRVFVETMKIAAVALAALGIYIFFEMKAPSTMQTLLVPAGQRAELILPDSTKVWLNSHSRLTYPLSFNKKERTVTLDGEAFFDVKHNGKQFVVQTNNFNVRVLGTRFNVFAYSTAKENRVDLLRGSIQLEDKKLGSRTLMMKPNESVTLLNNTITLGNIADYDYFRWTDGLICFNNESVTTIIKKLELYYDTHIIVKRTNFLNERYSGKFFVKDGIEQVLKVLQIELKFSYTKNEDKNLITIK
jgi:transmembrane sensor